MNCFIEICFSLSFALVNWNLITVETPGKRFWPPSRNIPCWPCGQNPSTSMLQTMIADVLLSSLKTFIRSQTCQESSDVNIDNSSKYCSAPNLQNRKRIDKNPPTSCVPYFILRGLEFLFGRLGPKNPSMTTRLPPISTMLYTLLNYRICKPGEPSFNTVWYQ